VFDDRKALDDFLEYLLLLAFGLFSVNVVLLAIATWGLSRVARRRGRRGNVFPALALALAVEVALIAIALADPIDSTIVVWLALSFAVMGLALLRLLAPQTDAPADVHSGP
jgi:NhaP-type Na+/H+ or K+/H+ antiporter